MRLRRLLAPFALAAALLVPAGAHASPVTLDFDSLSDLDQDPVFSTTFGQVTFFNATALASFYAAFGSLNDAEFPPYSYNNVISAGHYLPLADPFDPLVVDPASTGTMRIGFSQLMGSVGGFFTWADGPLTLTAYDAANNLMSQVSTLASDNLLSPNQFLSLTGTGISYVDIAGAGPFRFTIDDLTLTPLATTPVPEPGTFVLTLTGVVAAAYFRRRRRA